jgi:hypothetical protein
MLQNMLEQHFTTSFRVIKFKGGFESDWDIILSSLPVFSFVDIQQDTQLV